MSNDSIEPGEVTVKSIRIEPVTPARWPDLESLFSLAGICRSCYCMAWRVRKRDWEAGRSGGNREAMRRRVHDAGPAPGLIAYADDGQPVGWVSVAPRAEFVTLANSRIWAPVDDSPGVWSITCFFIAKPFRRRGLTVALIGAAVEFARQHGAAVVEAYPIDPATEQPSAFMWTGLASAFLRAGFTVAARRSPQKPIMRWTDTASSS